MKTCESMERQILLAQSGELGETELTALAEHVSVCPACRLYQRQVAWISERTPRILETKAPVLDSTRLATRARCRNRPLLRYPVSFLLGAAAALILALFGTRYWLADTDSEEPPPHHRLALLNEWQFWMVSLTGESAEQTNGLVFAKDWSQGELARHLLVLEGLVPEDDSIEYEEMPDVTPGELPPITLQGYSIRELLRS
ncbi:MAG: hypothetical protein R6X19_05835 [Kiritimatiellia bacterium]